MKRFVLSLILSFVPLFALALGDADRDGFLVGTYQSPKGVGVSFDLPVKGGEYISMSAIFDMSGILIGKASTGGGRVLISQNFILKDWTTVKKPFNAFLYMGPAATLGYLRDTENYMGYMAGIGVLFGFRLDFESRFSLSLEFEADASAHLSKDRTTDKFKLGLYDNGYLRSFYPQLKIMYRL